VSLLVPLPPNQIARLRRITGNSPGASRDWMLVSWCLVWIFAQIVIWQKKPTSTTRTMGKECWYEILAFFFLFYCFIYFIYFIYLLFVIAWGLYSLVERLSIHWIVFAWKSVFVRWCRRRRRDQNRSFKAHWETELCECHSIGSGESLWRQTGTDFFRRLESSLLLVHIAGWIGRNFCSVWRE
jgi:hypothetical protein